MSAPLKRLWSQSSSLIVLGRNKGLIRENGFDYKVLVLERPSRGTFPGGYVFPGGVSEQSDESKEWLNLYRNVGIDGNKLKTISKQLSTTNVAQQADGTGIAREIASRITAIRETFEEVGILLCKNQDGFHRNELFAQNFDAFDVKYWQREVHNDSLKFLELCQMLKVAPDLWSLFDWSAWLTPTSFKRRFEAAFYLVALDNQDDIHAAKVEVKSGKWESPSTLLDLHRGENIWLPPPQLYELSRICKQSTLDELTRFAATRNSKTTLLFPIPYHLSDGVVHCYPGDDFYPKTPDFAQTSHNVDEFDKKTCDEFRGMAKNIHRSEHFSLHDVKIVQNLDKFDNHINASTQYSSKL